MYMINTAPPVSNSVYGREKLFWYDKINSSNHACHCGAVVKELLARAAKPGSTPGAAVYCLCVPFFSAWSPFFNAILLFAFFFILTADLAGYALGSIYILSLSPKFYLKGVSKALVLHTGQAVRPDKNHKLPGHVPSLKQLNFFSMLVDIMTDNTQYTTNYTNLHPTPTSDPLCLLYIDRLNHQYYYPKISTEFAPQK